jgi:hypothetical protein
MNEPIQNPNTDFIPLPSLDTPWPTPIPIQKDIPMTPTRRWIHRRFLKS